jgi:alpha-L-rhamnosidase
LNSLAATAPFALALLAGFIPRMVFGQPAAPAGLLVNGARSPLAIDRDATRFTWRSVDARRGETQRAYQILVASTTERLAAGKADWWDSGKVDSDQSASVEYAGKPLLSATRFRWKVRIWDQTGKPGG